MPGRGRRDLGAGLRAVGPALGRARRRATAAVWPLAQGTAAATVAWILADRFGSHDHPFFAPIAAVVALNQPLGERGASALRLVAGVIVGILAGELTVALLGGGYGRLALATFAATAVASTLGGTRLVVIQAASAAILTVAVADGEAGIHRLVDALIGTGVALVGTQFLFSPEPVRLVRRAEAAALSAMAGALALTRQALERDDEDLVDEATRQLREVRDGMSELARLRRVSTRVARHSLVWRWRMAPVVHEHENAGHLDLLGASCLVLVRTAMATSVEERRLLAPSVAELSRALAGMADDPGDRRTRQDAVERAVESSRRLRRHDLRADTALAAVMIAIQMVAADIMVFAGVDAEQAAAAAMAGTGELEAIAPPPLPRLPFRPGRRPPPA